MKGRAIHPPALIQSALGAVLAVLCGLLLWGTSLGEPWTNASYDYLFRFGSHAVTNRVTLILMDNDAFESFHQTRGEPWDRSLHAQLLNRLADDGASLVVMDSFFRYTNNPAKDAALAAAMQRQPRLVLMAEQSQVIHPDIAGAQPILPAEIFLNAAKTNWGVAWVDPDDGIVRQHWPFPSPGPYPSMAETAARVFGTPETGGRQERWLRYYGEDGAWTKLSYRFALSQPTNFYHGQIVFIGTWPKTSLPDGEPDEFSTPYSRWNREATGGVRIMLTSFLNLVNDDWLRRPAGGLELLLLVISGIFLGAGLIRLRPFMACMTAAVFAGVIALAAILWSFHSNYWFPWLIISGAQVPCALTVSLIARIAFASEATGKKAVTEKLPVTPGYELFQPPIGEGAYGKVWLARNKAGQWRALKAIYLSSFNQNTGPYDREFAGVTRYQAVSGKHPGLLRVDFVSAKLDGYFYYVMELADSTSPRWEKFPAQYQPHDLAAERARSAGKRLPVRECLRLGLVLTEALEFLHQQGLTHRDIKPQNIIFVNGQPKLADLGLIAEIRPENQQKTIVGTPGYMPPLPERPGTPQADIFSLGMVLYVMCAGRDAGFFPDISTHLVSSDEAASFLPFNAIILKACQPDAARRYASAAEMHQALLALKEKLALE